MFSGGGHERLRWAPVALRYQPAQRACQNCQLPGIFPERYTLAAQMLLRRAS